ncbi:SMI1/KNR4 family protein [Hymenobacter sp. CRA2]|uniref:SMI1/KNR4 family protein n=1 Tax=Hymenobacter sp. CRA2 TaxID=1955620 RepID=UPI00098F2079|nr:SMI1/KNR4 family protein [Hymenobacter sp. CRA2]OON66186.1 hypothetical protein B0919_22105 [Hymenobacter sp. CRA2]
MLKQTVLRAIQAGKEDEYQRAVTDAALYLAVAGFLPDATVLLQALWQQGLPRSPHVGLQDRAFQVLWQTAGMSVPGAPLAWQSLDTLEQEHRRYVGGDRYAYPMPDVEWQELSGKNAFRQAQTWFVNAEADAETLFLLKQALLRPQELSDYEYTDATAMAAEAAARSGDEALAQQMLQQWVARALDPNWSLTFAKLAAGRHTAPLLLRGALAAELGLTPEQCRQDVAELVEALQTREARGVQPVFAHLSWSQLLTRLNELALAEEPEILEWANWEGSWLGRAGASTTQIAAKEQALGLTLPADYKAFLLVSDGLVGSPTDPELLPVAEMGFYRQLEDPELYTITASYADVESDDEAATIAPYVERALLASRVPAEQMLWLIPPAKSGDDWQTWFFAAWVPGEERYPSFRHYVEQRVQELEHGASYYWNG